MNNIDTFQKSLFKTLSNFSKSYISKSPEMKIKLVRHYESDFPVEGEYPGYYKGEPALFIVENSLIKYIKISSGIIGFGHKINKNQVELIIRS